MTKLSAAVAGRSTEFGETKANTMPSPGTEIVVHERRLGC